MFNSACYRLSISYWIDNFSFYGFGVKVKTCVFFCIIVGILGGFHTKIGGNFRRLD
jgi:hypothetical protein